ncbi:unnamed protein product, partial [Pylaiella littoralis]
EGLRGGEINKFKSTAELGTREQHSSSTAVEHVAALLPRVWGYPQTSFFRSRQAPHNCQDVLCTSLCRRPLKPSECDDLLATTVLSVAIAALHHREQHDRPTRVRSMAQWAVVLEELDAAFLWPEEDDDDDVPRAKRTRCIKERKNWK